MTDEHRLERWYLDLGNMSLVDRPGGIDLELNGQIVSRVRLQRADLPEIAEWITNRVLRDVLCEYCWENPAEPRLPHCSTSHCTGLYLKDVHDSQY